MPSSGTISPATWMEDHESMSKDPQQQPRRQYPPLYERIVPIALILIALAIIIVLLIIFGTVLGLFPGS